MTGQSVRDFVTQLAAARGSPEAARLQAALRVDFKPAGDNPYWAFYEFELPAGLFSGGEFRREKAGPRALLRLAARETPGVPESDFDRGVWGRMLGLELKPDIPPEGADAYTYALDPVRVSLQFTHTSRRLRAVTLEWGGEDRQ
jgi:hypothetical protein